jgi:hypothetical protein
MLEGGACLGNSMISNVMKLLSTLSDHGVGLHTSQYRGVLAAWSHTQQDRYEIGAILVSKDGALGRMSLHWESPAKPLFTSSHEQQVL